MRTILLTIVVTGLLQAESVGQLITHALKKHPSLQAINHRLSAMDEKIAESTRWNNPDLILNINDIRFDDLSNRSLEPMQTQGLTLKQRFPWFGKTAARERLTRERKHLLTDSYAMAKVKLAEEIKKSAYTILEIRQRLKIVNDYEKLTQQNIDLFNAYTATSAKSHSNSMSAELLLSRLHIRKERYRAVLKSQEAKLRYLVQKKHLSLNGTLHISPPKPLGYYLSKLKENPIYQKARTQTRVAEANHKLKTLDKIPDPFVQIGYQNRQEFPDYGSIAVGVSLPIYGSEALESEAARKEALAAQSALIDYRASLESQIRTAYAGMMEAYRIYRIIKEESLPKLAHMFELNEASIQNGEDLFTYTNLLEQKLDLVEEQTVAQATYLRRKATLTSLIGATR